MMENYTRLQILDIEWIDVHNLLRTFHQPLGETLRLSGINCLKEERTASATTSPSI